MKNKILLIIIYSIVAYVITSQLSKTQGHLGNPVSTMIVSENPIYTNQEIILNPGYATTYQKILIGISSPYVKINFNASLDNQTWNQTVNLNFTSCDETTNTNNFTYLGDVNLNQLQLHKVPIYVQYRIPEQTLPNGVTKEMAENNSIFPCIIAKSDLTSNDRTLRIVLFITILGILLSITDFLQRKKY
jgi:hypothetical protein